MNEEKIPMKISLISSSFSGMLHILLGYPFDTMKTLRQSGRRIDISKISKKRLFKGIKYPMMQHSFINSTAFGLNNFFLNNIDNKYISNFLTAATTTIILTPFDKFKIMSQHNYKFPLNFKNILNSYKNFHVVCACEVPSTFLYFFTYRTLKEKQLPIFLCGGFAGLSSWVFTYPIDTIKTRMQNDSCKSIKEAFNRGKLYNGFLICIFRSFFVNGVNFYSYEKITKFLMKT